MAHKKNKKRKTAYQEMDDFETHFNVVMKRAKTNYVTQDVAEWIMLNFLMVIDEYFTRNEDSESFTKEQKVRMLARLACMIDESLTRCYPRYQTTRSSMLTTTEWRWSGALWRRVSTLCTGNKNPTVARKGYRLWLYQKRV